MSKKNYFKHPLVGIAGGLILGIGGYALGKYNATNNFENTLKEIDNKHKKDIYLQDINYGNHFMPLSLRLSNAFTVLETQGEEKAAPLLRSVIAHLDQHLPHFTEHVQHHIKSKKHIKRLVDKLEQTATVQEAYSALNDVIQTGYIYPTTANVLKETKLLLHQSKKMTPQAVKYASFPLEIDTESPALNKTLERWSSRALLERVSSLIKYNPELQNIAPKENSELKKYIDMDTLHYLSQRITIQDKKSSPFCDALDMYLAVSSPTDETSKVHPKAQLYDKLDAFRCHNIHNEIHRRMISYSLLESYHLKEKIEHLGAIEDEIRPLAHDRYNNMLLDEILILLDAYQNELTLDQGNNLYLKALELGPEKTFFSPYTAKILSKINTPNPFISHASNQLVHLYKKNAKTLLHMLKEHDYSYQPHVHHLVQAQLAKAHRTNNTDEQYALLKVADTYNTSTRKELLQLYRLAKNNKDHTEALNYLKRLYAQSSHNKSYQQQVLRALAKYNHQHQLGQDIATFTARVDTLQKQLPVSIPITNKPLSPALIQQIKNTITDGHALGLQPSDMISNYYALHVLPRSQELNSIYSPLIQSRMEHYASSLHSKKKYSVLLKLHKHAKKYGYSLAYPTDEALTYLCKPTDNNIPQSKNIYHAACIINHAPRAKKPSPVYEYVYQASNYIQSEYKRFKHRFSTPPLMQPYKKNLTDLTKAKKHTQALVSSFTSIKDSFPQNAYDAKKTLNQYHMQATQHMQQLETYIKELPKYYKY